MRIKPAHLFFLAFVSVILLSCQEKSLPVDLPQLHSAIRMHSTFSPEGSSKENTQSAIESLRLSVDLNAIDLEASVDFKRQFKERISAIEDLPPAFRDVNIQKVIDVLLGQSSRMDDLKFVFDHYLEDGGSEAIHIAHVIDFLKKEGIEPRELKSYAQSALKNIEAFRGDRYGYEFAKAIEYLNSI